MRAGSLATVIALSLLGLALAGGAALLVRRLGESERGRPLVALVGAVGLALACALPFLWVRLVGGAP